MTEVSGGLGPALPEKGNAMPDSQSLSNLAAAAMHGVAAEAAAGQTLPAMSVENILAATEDIAPESYEDGRAVLEKHDFLFDFLEAEGIELEWGEVEERARDTLASFKLRLKELTGENDFQSLETVIGEIRANYTQNCGRDIRAYWNLPPTEEDRKDPRPLSVDSGRRRLEVSKLVTEDGVTRYMIDYYDDQEVRGSTLNYLANLFGQEVTAAMLTEGHHGEDEDLGISGRGLPMTLLLASARIGRRASSGRGAHLRIALYTPEEAEARVLQTFNLDEADDL